MDDMTPFPGEGPIPTLEPPDSGPQGFLANPQTRMLVIVAAVVALLVVVGAVAGLVFVNLGKKAAEQAAVDGINASLNAAPKTAAVATGSVETTVEGTKVSVPVTNKDVFTSRDPFLPVLKALPAVVASSAPTTPSADVRNVLVLENISNVGGVLMANFSWEGTLYDRVEAGKQIGASPWQVLSLTKTTATMLYGDVQITLSIGEGVAKD